MMRKQNITKDIHKYLKYDWIQFLLTSLICASIFFLVTYSNVYTETYDIEKFSTANETIRSPYHH